MKYLKTYEGIFTFRNSTNEGVKAKKVRDAFYDFLVTHIPNDIMSFTKNEVIRDVFTVNVDFSQAQISNKIFIKVRGYQSDNGVRLEINHEEISKAIIPDDIMNYLYEILKEFEIKGWITIKEYQIDYKEISDLIDKLNISEEDLETYNTANKYNL